MIFSCLYRITAFLDVSFDPCLIHVHPVAPSVGVSPNHRPKRAASLGYRNLSKCRLGELASSHSDGTVGCTRCTLLQPSANFRWDFNCFDHLWSLLMSPFCLCLLKATTIDAWRTRTKWHAYLEYCVCSKRASLSRVAFQKCKLLAWSPTTVTPSQAAYSHHSRRTVV